ncbi:MAG TPA: enoyl-CoA hydratase/isomerase family protein [Candidatus Eisenbacteria bacterium]|nr:enoyl-CoA hydratase/isomerase family protein [Candidatus Eisenbacteria bacterium]
MEEPKVLYEVRDKIAWVTLNRPEALNAVNREMREKIIDRCRAANDDPAVQVVIFRGAGDRAFSVGGDLKERARANAAESAPGESPLVSRQARNQPGIHTPPQAIAAITKPTVALLHGYVIGTGLLMSLACDIRIGAETARIGLTEIRRGFMPASGGTQRLARLVGIAKALEICLSGELFDASEAYRIGLLNQIVPADKLLESGEQVARSFLKGAPLAARYIKEAIYKGAELPLEQALRLEADLAGMVLNTEDAKEGPRAFVEKRAPAWKGK